MPTSPIKPTRTPGARKTVAKPAVAKKPAIKKARARKAAAAPAKASPKAATELASRSAAKTDSKAQPAPKPKPKPKQKLVRDSFTMPQQDFDLIAALKKRALDGGQPAKKSELLRAGLHALTALDNAALRRTLGGLVALKPGRPRKEN